MGGRGERGCGELADGREGERGCGELADGREGGEGAVSWLMGGGGERVR